MPDSQKLSELQRATEVNPASLALVAQDGRSQSVTFGLLTAYFQANINAMRTDFSNSSALLDSVDTSFTQVGSGARLRTGQNKFQDAVSIFDFIPLAEQAAILDGSSTYDCSADIQKCVDAHSAVNFVPGLINLTEEINLRSGFQINLTADTQVLQLTPGKNAFVATETTNTWIFMNGGSIRGPGGWSSGWTGMQGNEGYRGVRFVGCEQSGIVGPGRVYNWGNAGIDFTGGSGLLSLNMTVAGTQGYSQPLTVGDNNQVCVYITNDSTYGPADDVSVLGGDQSGSCHGTLREAQVSPPTGPTRIMGVWYHDMPGQHGIYNQESNVTVANCRGDRIALSLVKMQAADADRPTYGFSATGIVGYDCGAALFEIAAISANGSVEDFVIQGEGHGVATLAAFKGGKLSGTYQLSGSVISDQAININENNLNSPVALGRGINISGEVDCSDVGGDAVIISSRNTHVTIKPKIKDINTGGGGSFATGILVVGDSTVTCQFLDISDTTGNMDYGIRNLGAQFIGSIATTTLTVTSVTFGKIVAGQVISGSGITNATAIVAQLTDDPMNPDVPGGIGTYSVSISQTAPSTTITAPTLCVVDVVGSSSIVGAAIAPTDGPVGGLIWKNYTPVLSASGGAITTYSINHASYQTTGMGVMLTIDVTTTTIGTATGLLFVTPPFAAASACSFAAFETNVLGGPIGACIRPADLTQIALTTNGGSSPLGDGRRYVITGSYERS